MSTYTVQILSIKKSTALHDYLLVHLLPTVGVCSLYLKWYSNIQFTNLQHTMKSMCGVVVKQCGGGGGGIIRQNMRYHREIH